MSRSYMDKMRIAYIRQYFLNETDEDHPADLKMIQNWLMGNGVEATAKTIRSDIEDLKSLSAKDPCALDISEVGTEYKAGIKKEYYTTDRPFELSELKMLIGAIAASKVISGERAEKLIEKIKSLANVHERKKLHAPTFFNMNSKTMGTSLLINADKIDEAIKKNHPISFDYLAFNTDKKLVKRYEEKDIVHPYYLVWSDDAYYLICYEPKRGEQLVHKRVDRMKSVNLLENEERKPLKEIIGADSLDLRTYLHRHINMYTGEIKRVEIKFTNDLLSVVIDQFGDDVKIISADDTSFFAYFNVVISQMFFSWCFRFGERAKIIGPEDVKEKYRASLQFQIESM